MMNPPPNTQPRSRTPAEKQASARQQQALNRIGGVFVFALLAGVPAAATGLLLYSMARRNRRHLQFLLLGMLVGLVLVGLSYKLIWAEIEVIRWIGEPYLPAFRALSQKPSRQTWGVVQPAIQEMLPHFGRIWLMLLPLAPLLALQLEGSRSKKVREQMEEKRRKEEEVIKKERRQAAEKAKAAPEEAKGLAVIGVSFGGDLGWTAQGWATYSAQMLNRHAVIIGGSGTGKTEFILRVAYLARKVYGWKVFYVDAKGDRKTAERFIQTMQSAGVKRTALFPDESYNGWQGDAAAQLNRMMSIEDYSEPYYRAVAKTVLSLAISAPIGPPRSSVEFLGRLKLDALQDLYQGVRGVRADALLSLQRDHVEGVLRRYFGFFDSLGGKLDGLWSFDTVDAGYILLEGLALKEEARSLGRYVLEDFANYVSARKNPDENVLFIVDEFSAIAVGGADAANLFERIRSYGAGIMVTAQTDEGLGDDAKKLIGAAAVTIAFQCSDPKPIAERAGMTKEIQSSIQAEYSAAGQNPLLSNRAHLMGTSVEREQEVFKLHPDKIRHLAVGECCIIANGMYQSVSVARLLPKKPKPSDGKVKPSEAPSRLAIEITPKVGARTVPLSVSIAEEPQDREELPIEELDLLPVPATQHLVAEEIPLEERPTTGQGETTQADKEDDNAEPTTYTAAAEEQLPTLDESTEIPAPVAESTSNSAPESSPAPAELPDPPGNEQPTHRGSPEDQEELDL